MYKNQNFICTLTPDQFSLLWIYPKKNQSCVPTVSIGVLTAVLPIMKNKPMWYIRFMFENIYSSYVPLCGPSVLPAPWIQAGPVIFFGEWNIHDQDATQGLTSICAIGFSPLHVCRHYEKIYNTSWHQCEKIPGGGMTDSWIRASPSTSLCTTSATAGSL